MRSYSIGRDAAADIPIADTSVSRLHAEVSDLGGGRLNVTDRGSSNGTFLVRNGIPQKIDAAEAKEGDVVRFGSVDIAVADLKDILRRKAGPEPAKAAYQLAKSQRLIRCDCGAVRPVDGACPFCPS